MARMEGVEEDRFTQVFVTKKGRPVRLDFHLLDSQHRSAVATGAGQQEIEGTPFERVLEESVIEIVLEPEAEPGREVTIAQHQKLVGYSRTGGLLLKRATRAKLDEALDGIERLL